MTSTNCTCQNAGFCQRHGIEKNSHFVHLCQTNFRYFNAWEQGRGPKQVRKGSVKQLNVPGPGTLLVRTLKEYGYTSKKGCGCDSKARTMNIWGPAKCRERIDEIVGWLTDAAEQEGWLEKLAVSLYGVRYLVERKIRKIVLETIERSEAMHKEAYPFPSGRVGFISYAYNTIGGVETWHQTLIPNLPITVSGFVVTEPNLAIGDFSKLGVPHGIGMNAARELCIQSDVVVVWGLGRYLVDLLATVPLKDRPGVISVSHTDNNWAGTLVEKQDCASDLVVFVSPSGLAASKVKSPKKLIPNSASPHRVFTVKEKAELRKEYGIPADAKVVSTVSRLSPEKRIDVMISAMEHLPSDYYLLIAGHDKGTATNLDQELRKMAEAIKGPRIKFLGPVDTPAEVLRMSDAYLNCSFFEGYGISMAEAMLARVPVISTRVGLLEMHPQSAYLLPQTPKDDGPEKDVDPSYLAKAIREVVENPVRYMEQVSSAYYSVRITQQFVSDWTQAINQVAEQVHKKPPSLEQTEGL